jgi:uncharacterized protein (DUF2252 family)
VILVEGKGSPDGNYLLDLKEAQPSSLAPWVATPQPLAGRGEPGGGPAKRLQAIPWPFCRRLSWNGAYILRGLQPSEDRGAGRLERQAAPPRGSARHHGPGGAWAHLRSAGRQGSAIADAFVDFGQRRDWQGPLIEQADSAAAMVLADWQAYSAAFDAGYFA